MNVLKFDQQAGKSVFYYQIWTLMRPYRRIHIPAHSAALLLSLVFLSCKKDTNVSPGKPATVIYIGGAQNGQAAFWKNGVKTTLVNRHGLDYAAASSIAISGSDVYVSGTDITPDFQQYGLMEK
jgi:hypothetical protein